MGFFGLFVVFFSPFGKIFYSLETHCFGDEGPESEVARQTDPSQDSLHLRYARTCSNVREADLH